MIAIPADLVRPRRRRQADQLVEVRGSRVLVLQDLGVDGVHRRPDLLHRALEISPGAGVEAQDLAGTDDDRLVTWRLGDSLLSDLVLDLLLLRAGELLGDLG